MVKSVCGQSIPDTATPAIRGHVTLAYTLLLQVGRLSGITATQCTFLHAHVVQASVAHDFNAECFIIYFLHPLSGYMQSHRIVEGAFQDYLQKHTKRDFSRKLLCLDFLTSTPESHSQTANLARHPTGDHKQSAQMQRKKLLGNVIRAVRPSPWRIANVYNKRV